MGSFSADHYKILVALFAAISVYILPSLIAIVFKRRAKARIILINLLLGWTVIGWLIALLQSMRATPEDDQGRPAA
jgi:hypothetical protein